MTGTTSLYNNIQIVQGRDHVVILTEMIHDARFVPMTRVAGELHEYACHEGNYGLQNTLAGARVEELGR